MALVDQRGKIRNGARNRRLLAIFDCLSGVEAGLQHRYSSWALFGGNMSEMLDRRRAMRSRSTAASVLQELTVCSDRHHCCSTMFRIGHVALIFG